MDTITLTINGRKVEAQEGMTVLQAAQAAGIYIPTLCADPHLKPYGACRVCLVEVEGMAGLPASCTTQAAEGMTVHTQSPRLDRIRRHVVELLLAHGHEDCVTCALNQACQLQEVAAYVGVRERPYRGAVRTYPMDDSNPFFVLDLNKCILCARCVRACDELQGRDVYRFAHRGFWTQVAPGLGQAMIDSVCESCGQCVAHCPTGALYDKAAYTWGRPTREVRTICPYCGVGCGLYLQMRDNQVIGMRGDPDNPVNWGRACVKGRYGYEFINHQERLTKPLIRRNGRFEEATWDEALDLVAERLREIRDTYGPDALAVLSSAKCTNEENYLLQKLARAVLGTNNVDHCARL
ncbi:MAG: 2Fe-2S iron-sulfur cluster-binding protein [Anaerolineae bacterium]